jgi:hypothetical protein
VETTASGGSPPDGAWLCLPLVPVRLEKRGKACSIRMKKDVLVLLRECIYYPIYINSI